MIANNFSWIAIGIRTVASTKGYYLQQAVNSSDPPMNKYCKDCSKTLSVVV